ncbi:MAG TPA: S1 RNA-binding domain-containing protein, partial [Acidimicrobiia bacterium]|nr:S1 RNA-binding domain-containing protein [Acidimicrobiia bacterium]
MFEQEGPSTPAPEVAGPESTTQGAPAATEAEEAPAAPAPSAPAPAPDAAPAADEAPSGGGAPSFGGTDADGEYQPMQVVSDDLGGMSFADAISGTIVEFDEGDIVTGKVVKVDKDEVLLDIGYKSEGVIPNRELSIRHDIDPHEVVATGDVIEALVLQKEDKEGRLILSKKRAQYERAWGTIERVKEANGVVSGPVIEVVKGGLIL